MAFRKEQKAIREPEMTDFESEFVLGLLREKQPQKILEVGVAGGGMTDRMLRVMSECGRKDWRMYSMDRSERLYHGPKHRTGFLADDIIGERGLSRHHQFMFGKVLPEFLPEIGEGIDFMVLDTVHTTPGEILDFLCVLPYLADGAVVCLHDVQYWHGVDATAVATNVLFHSVVAEHIVPQYEDENGERRLANIAAFRVTPETRKHVMNVFLGLTMPWGYVPVNKDLLAYGRFLKAYYDAELFDLLRATLRDQDACNGKFRAEYLVTGKKIMIYAANSCGRKYYDILRQPKLGNDVVLVDRQAGAWNDVFGTDVKTLSDVRVADFDFIYIAVRNFDTANDIYQTLRSMGAAADRVQAIV